jgi:hypothetical protein
MIGLIIIFFYENLPAMPTGRQAAGRSARNLCMNAFLTAKNAKTLSTQKNNFSFFIFNFSFIMGVPLRVGLSVPSPRSFLAPGFPLQSLTPL